MGKKKAGKEPIIDDRPAVIVDELAEVAAVDPTFGGIRKRAALEAAHTRVVAALREKHGERFRHAPPEDPEMLLLELDDEIVLPHVELIRKLLHGMKEEQRLMDEDEKRILKVVNAFLKGLKEGYEPGY